MKDIHTEHISFMNTHTGIRMVNGKENNAKIICAQNKEEKTMKCLQFTYSFYEEEVVEREIRDENDVIKKIIKKNQYEFTLTYEHKINFSYLLNGK